MPEKAQPSSDPEFEAKAAHIIGLYMNVVGSRATRT